MNLPLLLVSPFVGAAIASLCLALHALTKSGAVAAAVTVAITLALGGRQAFVILLLSFLTISLVGKATHRRRKAVEAGIPEKEGARDGVQVAVNGIPAVLSILFWSVTGQACFFFGFVAALSEALSDSMASEIGVLSQAPPRDICTWRKTAPGLSGGVSALGFVAALSGACLVILFSLLSPLRSLPALALTFLSAVLGVLFDSILGSRLQAKFRCRVCGKATEKHVHCGDATEQTGGLLFLRNDLVNLCSNLLSAILAILFTALL